MGGEGDEHKTKSRKYILNKWEKIDRVACWMEIKSLEKITEESCTTVASFSHFLPDLSNTHAENIYKESSCELKNMFSSTKKYCVERVERVLSTLFLPCVRKTHITFLPLEKLKIKPLSFFLYERRQKNLSTGVLNALGYSEFYLCPSIQVFLYA